MGHRKWSDKENAVLADIYKGAANLVDQLHRLPGRSYRGCMMHAIYMGFAEAAPTEYSPEEDSIIRKGYRAGTPVKLIMQKLPGRTHGGILARAARLGLNGKHQGHTGSKWSWIEDAARDELEDGIPMTTRALAAAIGASKEGTIHMLRRVHGKSFYIADWERTPVGWAAMWLVGKCADVPKPAPESNSTKCRRARTRRLIRSEGFNPFATVAMQVTA